MRAALGGSLKGKIVALLGLTFKPNTDDMRDAPSLVIVPALQQAGARIRAYDPEGMKGEARHLLPGIEFCDSAADAMQGADAMALLTEWNEFRALDLDRVGASMTQKVLVDLRNVYRAEDVRTQGFRYTSIGRP